MHKKIIIENYCNDNAEKKINSNKKEKKFLNDA